MPDRKQILLRLHLLFSKLLLWLLMVIRHRVSHICKIEVRIGMKWRETFSVECLSYSDRRPTDGCADIAIVGNSESLNQNKKERKTKLKEHGEELGAEIEVGTVLIAHQLVQALECLQPVHASSVEQWHASSQTNHAALLLKTAHLPPPQLFSMAEMTILRL